MVATAVMAYEQLVSLVSVEASQVRASALAARVALAIRSLRVTPLVREIRSLQVTPLVQVIR